MALLNLILSIIGLAWYDSLPVGDKLTLDRIDRQIKHDEIMDCLSYQDDSDWESAYDSEYGT